MKLKFLRSNMKPKVKRAARHPNVEESPEDSRTGESNMGREKINLSIWCMQIIGWKL